MSKTPDKPHVRFSMMKGDPPPKPQASGSTSKKIPSDPPPSYKSKIESRPGAESKSETESKSKTESKGRTESKSKTEKKPEPRRDSKSKSSSSKAPFNPWEEAKKLKDPVEAASSKSSRNSHASAKQSVQASSSKASSSKASSSKQESRASSSGYRSSAAGSLSRSSTKAFRDCTISMAVDVSRSTAGVASVDLSAPPMCLYVDGPGKKIIEVEQQVVSTIHSELSSTAKQKMRIIPWDFDVLPILHAEDVGQLRPGGGTFPSSLCENRDSVAYLQQSSLWFLMTDGGVDPDEVYRFSHAFSDIHLHGTACVVVIYDALPPRPSQVNISVGYTVFAVAPHCLLLFHDMVEHELYILRAKGCFESLLDGREIKSSRGMSQSQSASSQRQSTSRSADEPRWEELTRINYLDLVKLQIPNPARLSRDEIALSDGSSVRVNDVLSSKVSERVSSKILSNEQDLNSLLSTATSRGLDRQAERWLADQRQAASSSGNRDSEKNVKAGQSLLSSAKSTGLSSLGGLGGSASRRGL